MDWPTTDWLVTDLGEARGAAAAGGKWAQAQQEPAAGDGLAGDRSGRSVRCRCGWRLVPKGKWGNRSGRVGERETGLRESWGIAPGGWWVRSEG
ncbi:hypothetical protein ABZP36_009246 [Zizania latifolia]